MSAGFHTVHVRVNDAATGQPTPCRIRFTGPDGTYYAPFGRLTEFAVGPNVDVGGNLSLWSKKYAYIDGTCEVRLPAGPLTIEASKGPEYTTLRHETRLAPGKLAIRLTLQRWANLREEGWYSGDARAHFLTPHAALLEGRAEDLAVVNLLACPTVVAEVEHPLGLVEEEPHAPPEFPAIPNILAFSGQAPALESQGCLVAVNTHNRHPVLGSLALLHCHRVVYPLTFGHRPWGEVDDWTLADWCDQCHRKGGLVVWTKTDQNLIGANYGEALADLILGKVDAVEVARFSVPLRQEPDPWAFDWYGLLSCGFHVPLVGASEKESNFVPLGCARTYARLLPVEPFNYRNWIEAVRAGRTFVTNGPLLTFTVDGHDPGAVLDVPASCPTVRVRASARSAVPFEQLELIANGAVVASGSAGEGSMSAGVETDLNLPAGGWVAARCRGRHHLPGYFSGQRVYAHTSPVYVQVEGRPPPVDRDAGTAFLGHLDRMLDWVQRKARCETEQQRERLRQVFLSARQVLAERVGGSVT